jgi:hypothetical protein
MQKWSIAVIIALWCYACQQHEPKAHPTIKTAELNWTQLAAWLPDIKGYQAMESTGENSHTGTSGSRYYAFARRQYKRNDKELTIEIIDYNEDQKTYKGLLNMYGFNTAVQNAQIQTRAVETGNPHVKALETVYTDSKDIRLTLAVADRFMIHISEPGGYDARLPEQVIQSIPFALINGRK